MTSFKIPPSALIFLSGLAIFTIIVSVLSEGMGGGVISTSFIKTIGKTLCLCLAAIAMDLVWGYCGILSLGHFAFFGLGGYMIGMWLMYARTETIVATSMAQAEIPPTPQEVIDKYDGIIRKSFIDFGISFDNYSRTSSKIHHETAQEFFRKLYDNGDFIEEVTEQLYDAKADQFLADRFVTGTCPKCDNPDFYYTRLLKVSQVE